MRRFFCIIICWLSWSWLVAQTPNVCIKGIELQGLKKTKAATVLGQMSVSEQDSVALEDVMALLDENKRLIFQTFLFTHVDVKIKSWHATDIILLVEVREAWYIYPIPVFELADRNFNVWWDQQNRDLRRVNLGAWLIWRNFTGFNDYLKLVGQFGYTRKFEVEYLRPPLGKHQKWGLGTNWLYSSNRELAYTTDSNLLVFYRDFQSTEYQYQRWRGSIFLTHRISLFDQQKLEIKYQHLSISDAVIDLNPNYFLDTNTVQQGFHIEYTYKRDKRDLWAYPQKGYYIEVFAEKNGLGIFKGVNRFATSLTLAYYLPLNQKWSLGARFKGRYTFSRASNPYNYQRALGYQDDYIRGFQYYVIDGQDYMLGQWDANFKIIEFTVPMWKKNRLIYLRELPVKIHMRYHMDVGQTWDRFYAQNNPLSNKFLWGTGMGLDIILYYYNIILQFEYSFTNTQEKGLYFRSKFNF